MTEDTWRQRDDASMGTGVGRRTFIAVGGGVGATLLAGCTSEDGGSDGTPTDDGSDGSGGGETANFRLLVSDAPADIDDFDRLDVTFSKARVFDGGDGEGEVEETEDGEGTETEPTESEATETEETETEETEEAETPTDTVEEDQQQATDDGTATENGTATDGADGGQGGEAEETDNGTETEDGESDDEGDRGFYVLELDSPTVDLTKVVGDVAQPIFDGELEAGSYQKLELHVEDVEGVVDGETVEVKVPSNKLQLTKPFEVKAGEPLDFVFDINVVKRGNQASYNLKPVISQSGVRGKDVEVEEVGEGDGDEGDGEQDDGSDEGAGSDGSDEEDGAGQGNETGVGNQTGGDGTGGNESAA